ncbi:[LSU ribosomal protein L11P]-lysine N-methyltransferase [Pseudooceanicola antarcticus]|uniref:Ribosomal protein L11 methyltransferase n=1 Tax=Pseudooceanicola antarcticus TaxID=1247613 RepID=A0A285ISU7_9RHOB|nr:50S ribosomal protein L11 methyltransferase [Pseudooceanicola antarcticus]PJE31932.1 50S ribosomal protein L11 methyltransferase [Pseudooceanicola antarcticus]SNY50893.1 [LSU ribosomal protein L11P]-lysine N-methyltransferase [Pseudooceanicola antarcticus]
MATWTALTTLTSKADAEALGAAMENLVPEATGIGVFEVEDDSGLWEVGGYFEEKPDIAGLELLAKMNGAKPFAVSELPETDWVAHVKRELAPVEAGRFFVYGSHDADKVPQDPAKIPLLIEAAMAFGTGHHGTTLGCLRALDRLDTEGFSTDRTADIGCGTAVLAMAAARIWPGTPVAGDIDPVAVEVAEANMRANDMAGRVTCVEAAGFGNPALEAGAPYGLVFANILMGPLISLAPDIAAHLETGGYAILSGLLNEQADAVQEAYENAGFTLHHAEQIREWTTLTLRKL